MNLVSGIIVKGEKVCLMSSRIVVALGGNALGNSISEQEMLSKTVAKSIVDLIEDGNEVIITHGNGPQVGFIEEAIKMYSDSNPEYGDVSISVCVAMSQALIACDLERCLKEEMKNRGLRKPVSTIITHVLVDSYDAAFENPTKPIGKFLTKAQAHEWTQKGVQVIEDSGRGYRRVVPSPKPMDILEIESIRSLIREGQVVIACGGGGIPVISLNDTLNRVDAVIDKDFTSSKLAQLIDADILLILTAVDKVAINFGKPNEQWLSNLKLDEAKRYLVMKHFGEGSMKPKIESAIEFINHDNSKRSIITSIDKAVEAVRGENGTIIYN